MAAALPDAVRRPAGVAIAATVLWGIGVIPVPRVYTEPDPAKRLEMLRAGYRPWVIGETLAAAGTAAVPAAFARIALALPPGRAKALGGLAAAALVAGAPLFVGQLAIRASDIERFAARRLPAWPFMTYSWLQVAALVSLSGMLASLPGRRARRRPLGRRPRAAPSSSRGPGTSRPSSSTPRSRSPRRACCAGAGEAPCASLPGQQAPQAPTAGAPSAPRPPPVGR
ncbi:hypothetical protein [Sinomonas mesophila]|uniref:hypothetical protein n=1 Tax=Sinomonas mesophila TaxID=1531955 RepID=UPI001FECE637|nr:hypothetical protein [Sinomonas mesophila]